MVASPPVVAQFCERLGAAHAAPVDALRQAAAAAADWAGGTRIGASLEQFVRAACRIGLGSFDALSQG
jgi:uncharacterized protein with von Willebrand factor type A (vWA) domain